MSLPALQQQHYFKCFLKEHKIQRDKNCFIGQETEALGIKGSPLSITSSCVTQHPKSCPAPVTAHSWDQGPAALVRDAQQTQGCREQLMMQGAE